MTESDILHLFHTSYAEIREPDIHYGRKNADFGQGFYLSDSDEFAGKWMRERKDAVIHVNAYELDLAGLQVLRFTRDKDWLDYILRNRAGYADAPTERGVKHLREMAKAAEQGWCCAVAFVIQVEGITEVRPNTETHPAFGDALAAAATAGVRMLHLPCRVTPDSLAILETGVILR